MSDDDETIAAYSQVARDFAKGFAHKKDPKQRDDLAAFVKRLPKGGRVLDLGCGPGHWAATFRDLGYDVDATDATAEMATLAEESFGISVRIEPFEALDADAIYDGVWANFSLLHAPRAAFPAHLARIHRALRPAGVLHLGMKLGSGQARDRLGRFYTYYSENELSRLVGDAGFVIDRSRHRTGRGLAGNIEPFVTLTAHA